MLIRFGRLLLVVILASLIGCSDDGEITRIKTLSYISVTPTNPSAAAGTTRQFTATGTYSDNSTQDLTALATWSSSDASKATVDASGKASALAYGTTTISATKEGRTGTTILTVTTATLSSIAVTPTNPIIANGTSGQFTAIGTFSDNSTQDLTTSAVWSSSDASKATVDSTGKAVALAAGTTTITATSGLISGSSTLTVTSATLSSIAVMPTNPIIANGTSEQFTATGTFSDSSTQDLTASVAWSSSDVTKTTIDTLGKASALAAGTTTITATSGLLSGSTTLTVTAAALRSIAVTPANPVIANGTSQQFTATGTFSDGSIQDLTTAVTWTSSDATKAAISNANGTRGMATALATGTTNIAAIAGSISGSTTLTVTAATLSSITITPSNPSISVNPSGTTLQFTATGTYTDGSTQDLTPLVTWSSSDVSKATISNVAGSNGKAATVAVGPTTITAILGTVSGTTTMTVTNAALVSITVTPVDPQVLVGGALQLTATGTYSDATTQNLTALVNWTSSMTSVATVSNASGSKGLAFGVAAGHATISATSGNILGSDVLEVEVP